jgi:putative spermidine/putrescine transport system permease protein
VTLNTDVISPPMRVSRPAAGRVLTTLRPAVGLVPFAAYTLVFLGLPTVAIVIGAFTAPAGGATLHNLDIAANGVYRKGFITSLELAALTAIVPAILGLVIAYAVHTTPRGALLRRMVTTASGVFANFGGVPLAFLFIATLGSTGVATKWLNSAGLNPYEHGFNLYTFSGIALVYMYFQIPLMVLVITPALEGLKPAWREAAHGLGAGSRTYWRLVGLPVLAPSVLGAVLLLFGSGFSAYATAQALTSGSVALTPIQIGSFLSGNVLSGQENVGKALGFGMILVVGVVMILYVLLQRRASRWLR